MKKVLFLNKKGGVGKTTMCFQMAIYFSSIGKKVLLVDCDSQGNLSGIFKKKDNPGLYELLKQQTINPSTCSKNIDIIPGDIRLSSLEEQLFYSGNYHILQSQLQEYENNYDYCFIDTGPSLGALTLNALLASDHLVLVVTPQLFTLEGTSDCIKTIVKSWSELGNESKLSAVILNRYDNRPILYRTVKQELDKHFSDTILKSSISNSIKYEESIQSGIGVALLGKNCKQKQEITNLGKELLSLLEE